MRKLLHIVTNPSDSLAKEVIALQRNNTGNDVEIIDLTISEPDYKALLEKIFAADSVEVW